MVAMTTFTMTTVSMVTVEIAWHVTLAEVDIFSADIHGHYRGGLTDAAVPVGPVKDALEAPALARRGQEDQGMLGVAEIALSGPPIAASLLAVSERCLDLSTKPERSGECGVVLNAVNLDNNLITDGVDGPAVIINLEPNEYVSSVYVGLAVSFVVAVPAVSVPVTNLQVTDTLVILSTAVPVNIIAVLLFVALQKVVKALSPRLNLGTKSKVNLLLDILYPGCYVIQPGGEFQSVLRILRLTITTSYQQGQGHGQ